MVEHIIEKMDAVISALGSILIQCGRPLCGPLCLNIKNLFKLQSNIQSLEKDLGELLLKKKDIQNEIEMEEKDGRIRTSKIGSWLTEVGEMESFVIPKLTDDCCLNCSLLGCRHSKQVTEKLKKVKQLMSSPSCERPYTVNPMVKPVEQLPGPSIKDQKTASINLAKLLDLLKDDRVGRIGMLGMGGIGKTTLIINLNNELESFNKELESINNAQPFTVVIWVVVSKEFQLGKVQDQIVERLKMTKVEGESTHAKATRLFNRLQMEKRFIVILDDVWEAIDLDLIGIPRPEKCVGCKLILTTRLQEVCRDMMTVVFPLSVLTEDESWDLFSQNAGEIVHEQGIRSLAQAVAKEGGGLPLAIIIMGRAMRGKQIDSWMRALKSLAKSNPVPYIPGIEKNLFLPLKLSYDSLEGHKNIKLCFLYCCLYPEDFSIEVDELLQCWEAEGLLDELEGPNEAYNIGLALIENLKDSCLLEVGYNEGSVRLHDVVRDVSVWIASSEWEHKSLIHQHSDSTQISGMQSWASYKRVSFMYGKIEILPQSVSQYSQVTSLLLQGNTRLNKVPIKFLEGFLGLRVLNLSDTGINSLPLPKILKELRALFLRNCLHLREFPRLQGHNKLEVLDLSGTCMEMSSYGIERMLKEVSCHDKLLDFYIDLLTTKCPHIQMSAFENLAWLRRLRRFRISIGSESKHPDLHERAAYLSGANSSSEAIKRFWSDSTALILVNCQHVINMWTGVIDVRLARLKSITIDSCSWTVSKEANDTQNDQVLLPSLEVLFLHHLLRCWSISDIAMKLGTNIRIIEILGCHDLKQLFPFDLLHKLENLEEIHVSSCDNLMEIITDCAVPVSVPQKLRVMKLKELPRVESVCRKELAWPCLQKIVVKNCPLLKKLPISSRMVNTMPMIIKGELNWWNQLQWEDENIKSNLQQYFKPLDHVGRASYWPFTYNLE